MAFSEKVLILRTGRFKEYDLWVRFLSPTRGILTGFAFGGCRSRRRFCGCLDSLNLVLFTINAGSRKKYLTLEEGTLINGFSTLKTQRDNLGIAANCIRFVQQICLEGDDSSAVYSLMLDSLLLLDNKVRVPSFFPLLFKAKATFMHGYEPLFNSCSRCGLLLSKIERPSFLYDNGQVVCSGCVRNSDQGFKARQKSLMFLDRLRLTRPKDWIAWNPEQEVLQDCFRIVDAYVQYHLE